MQVDKCGDVIDGFLYRHTLKNSILTSTSHPFLISRHQQACCALQLCTIVSQIGVLLNFSHRRA